MKFKTKNILRRTAVFILIAVMFTANSICSFSVSAAYYAAGADDLKSLGLFLGTDSGYDLDRAPTRIEAAVMLVRLLGKEAQAKEMNYVHPFTDVPEWAAPYVGYLYKNQFANGIGNNLFGSSELCNEKMFCAFVLRALGYTEAEEDFTYNTAFDFGVKIGIIDAGIKDMVEYYKNNNQKFDLWRDECVSIMYNALNVNIKGTETKLIDKLTNDKAVSAEAAESFASKNSIRKELNALLNKISLFDGKKPVRLEIYEMDNKPFGPDDIPEGVTVNYTNSTSNKTDLIISGEQYAMNTVSTMYGGLMSVAYEMYLKDGYVYLKGMGEKIKQKASEEDGSTVNSFLEHYNYLYGHLFTAIGAGAVNKIEKIVTDEKIVYKVLYIEDISGGYNNILDSVEPENNTADNESYVYASTVTYTFALDGKFISVSEEYNEINGTKVEYETTTEITIKASGDDIKIEFPDLSDYIESEINDSLPEYLIGI